MKAEIKQNQDDLNSYDLYVNGLPCVVSESIAVVNNVKTALIGGYLQPLKHSEADEIAASIKKKINAS